jgi:uncharacterized membrane protein (UPF0127 family)
MTIQTRRNVAVMALVALLIFASALYVAKPFSYRCSAICTLDKSLAMGILKLQGHNSTTDLTVYLAQTPQQQERGYMYATSLGNNCSLSDSASFINCNPKGMLFIFKNQSDECFWMKNTSMPLEQVWIAQNGLVLYVYDATPYSMQTICHEGMYVLETNATYLSIHAGERISTS